VPASGKKYFLFLKNKVRATTAKMTATPRQRQAKINVANT
jgi:hypothetical protein